MVCLLYSRGIKVAVWIKKDGLLYYAVIRQLLWRIQMNLPTFLRKSGEITKQLSKEQLIVVIHEIARTLPEHKREVFLDTLRAACQSAAVQSSKTIHDDHQQLLMELKHNQNILTGINNGIRYLDSEYNEEWDDWYNSDADEVLFSDPMGILSEIEDSIRLIHKCIDLAAYKEGCELAETLSVLEITAKGDYEDFCGEPLGICGPYYYSETFDDELNFARDAYKLLSI